MNATDIPLSTPDDIAVASSSSQLIIQITFIVMGSLYTFMGAKVYPVMHGLVCGLVTFFIATYIIGMIISPLVGLILGIVVAGLFGFQCFKMERLQAFVLGCQIGVVSGLISYLFLVSWWNTKTTL